MKGIALLALLALAPLAQAYDPLDPMQMPPGLDTLTPTVGLPIPMRAPQDYTSITPQPFVSPQLIEAPDVTRSTLQIYNMGRGNLQFHQIYGPEQNGGVQYYDYSGGDDGFHDYGDL